MKNATRHADELRSYFKRLLKEQKPEPWVEQEPRQALVRAAMSFDVSDARAQEAMAAIGTEFVDLNELRVATDLEIQELFGVKYPAIERRVEMITRSLNAIFEKEHTLSLDRLRTLSKRDARQFLRELPEIHPFVEAYVMLYAFAGHAVPVDDEIVAHLREQGILEEGAGVDDTQKFLEHSVKAEECHDLFQSLRRAAHAGDAPKGRSKKARV